MMDSSSWISFRYLLDRCEERKKGALLPFLSLEQQEKLKQIKASEKDPFSRCYSTKERVHGVHYSWLITFLEPFAEQDKTTILSALEKPQAQKLKNYFQLKENLIPLKSKAKEYLISAVYKWLISEQKEFLPIEFLPEHPLNPLLNLSKGKLQKLVDFLGLHDLALEMKHIIKSEQIKKIQKVLPKEKQDYLKSLLKIKKHLSFTRLNLDGWDGDGEKLKAILHHRGFNRLAKALFGCHPSLLWHICHKLDTGRAKILRKFFTNINNEEAQAVLTKQVVELIPTVQKSNEYRIGS